MAASGRAILQAHIDGFLPESLPIDVAWTLSGVIEILPTSLSSGDNPLPIAAGTKLIVLIPPVTSVATLIWSKTGGTVNGITQQPNLPNIIGYSAGAVVVNASASVNPVTLICLG